MEPSVMFNPSASQFPASEKFWDDAPVQQASTSAPASPTNITVPRICGRSFVVIMPEVNVSPPTMTRFARMKLPSGSASDAFSPSSMFSSMAANGQADAPEESNVPFTTRFVTDGSAGSALVEALTKRPPASTTSDGVPLNRAFSVSASVPAFTVVVPENGLVL